MPFVSSFLMMRVHVNASARNAINKFLLKKIVQSSQGDSKTWPACGPPKSLEVYYCRNADFFQKKCYVSTLFPMTSCEKSASTLSCALKREGVGRMRLETIGSRRWAGDGRNNKKGKGQSTASWAQPRKVQPAIVVEPAFEFISTKTGTIRHVPDALTSNFVSFFFVSSYLLQHALSPAIL